MIVCDLYVFINPMLHLCRKTIKQTNKKHGELWPKLNYSLNVVRSCQVLLIFLRFLSTYDRTGTIVGLDLQYYGDRLFSPSLCFHSYCKKKKKPITHKHTEFVRPNIEIMDLLQAVYWKSFFSMVLSIVLRGSVAITCILQTETSKGNVKI